MTMFSVVPLPSPRPWSVAMRTSSGPATVHSVTAVMKPSAAQIVRRYGWANSIERRSTAAVSARSRRSSSLIAPGGPHGQAAPRRRRSPAHGVVDLVRAARVRRPRRRRASSTRRDVVAVVVGLVLVARRPRGEHVAVARARRQQLVVRARGRRRRPPSSSTTLDARAIVPGRWAMTIVVRSRITVAIASRISCSFDGSTALGGVVEDEHPRVDEDRPGDGDALALAAAEREATLADHRVVALGQVVDELVGAGELARPARPRRAGRRAGRRRCCRGRCR